MRSYKYVARDVSGKLFRGTLETPGREDAFHKLKDDGLYPLKLEEVQTELKRVYRIKLKEIAFFCRQLSTMISSGLTVLKAIDILYNRAKHPKVKKAYLKLDEDIQKGLSLTEAFKEQEGVFPVLLVNMVQAGEMSGSLDVVMDHMAEYYEKENKLLNRVRSSLVYPMILVFVTLLVMVVLFVFVLPSFFTMFEGAEIPTVTKVVMAISDFLTHQWYLLIIAVLVVMLAVMTLRGIAGVRKFSDRLKIRMPLFGKLMMTVYVSRMTNSLAILYSSGISMLDTVNIAVNVLDNRYITEKFATVLQEIERGEMLSAAMERTQLFDPMVTSVIFVGEESGSLDTILAKLSAFYDDEAQTALQQMVTLMGPLMMIVIALLIAVIMVAVLLPIYNMYGTVL